MVSLEMLAGILNRVRRNCRVALLGDPNQLLSVGAGNVLSDLLTLGVPSICLQQQYRQSTDAAALRQNVVDFPKLNGEQELRWDDSFRLLPADDRAIPDLLCEEAARRYRAGESIQVLSPVRVKTGFSVQALNTRLQNEVNPLTATVSSLPRTTLITTSATAMSVCCIFAERSRTVSPRWQSGVR